MKAKLIVASKGPNPKYDPASPRSETNRPTVVKPVGTIVDDPFADVLCRGEEPIAVPADDACRTVIERYESQLRPAALQERQRYLSQFTAVQPGPKTPAAE
jgi:hypothetical protein